MEASCLYPGIETQINSRIFSFDVAYIPMVGIKIKKIETKLNKKSLKNNLKFILQVDIFQKKHYYRDKS